MSGEKENSYEVYCAKFIAKGEVSNNRRSQAINTANNPMKKLPGPLQRSVELARETGASSWLTTLPIVEFGFTLHKGAFTDALALRYGWPLSRTPSNCECGSSFSVDHSLSRSRGGFTILRHNETRYLTADLLTEVCHHVTTEPDLQPVTIESFNLRSTNIHDKLDIAMNRFWGGHHERTFIDVRVFNPHAPSNRKTSLQSCYNRHEREKKNQYERRVLEIEHSSFTPLIFAATGAMSKSTNTFYKRLASMLSQKWNNSYSESLIWLRCCLSFSLLRSSICCIRRARSRPGSPSNNYNISLITSEARISHPFDLT